MNHDHLNAMEQELRNHLDQLNAKVLTDDLTALTGYFVAMTVDIETNPSELHGVCYSLLTKLRSHMAVRMSQFDLLHGTAEGFLRWRINVANGDVRWDIHNGQDAGGISPLGLTAYVPAGTLVLIDECVHAPKEAGLLENVVTSYCRSTGATNVIETPVETTVITTNNISNEGGSDE